MQNLNAPTIPDSSPEAMMAELERLLNLAFQSADVALIAELQNMPMDLTDDMIVEEDYDYPLVIGRLMAWECQDCGKPVSDPCNCGE